MPACWCCCRKLIFPSFWSWSCAAKKTANSHIGVKLVLPGLLLRYQSHWGKACISVVGTFSIGWDARIQSAIFQFVKLPSFPSFYPTKCDKQASRPLKYKKIRISLEMNCYSIGRFRWFESSALTVSHEECIYLKIKAEFWICRQ